MEIMNLFSLADRLHCKPWELVDVGQAWITAAAAIMQIEQRADALRQQAR